MDYLLLLVRSKQIIREHIIDIRTFLCYNISDNRVAGWCCLHSLVNGGDVYGKLFFSGLDVLRNVYLSIAYVHFIEP